MNSLALLLLRLGIGVIFIAHGLQKAFGAFGGPGIKGFSGFLATLGFAPAFFWACVAAYVELLGGLFVLAGFFTRISSSLLFVLIIVATLKVHITKGLFLSNGGFEYNLLIACACLALAITGGGKISVLNKL